MDPPNGGGMRNLLTILPNNQIHSPLEATLYAPLPCFSIRLLDGDFLFLHLSYNMRERKLVQIQSPIRGLTKQS